MANKIGIKDFNKFSEKYKDVLEVTSYEYDNFVVNVSQKKVHSIDINILNISEDIQKKIVANKDIADLTYDIMKIRMNES